MSDKVHINVKNLSLNVPDLSNISTLGIFRGRKYIKILNDIKFNLKGGDVLGLLGKNGSGKSTLLKCITNIYSNYSGSISVNSKITPLLELGVGFNPKLTGLQNIYLILNLMDLDHTNLKLVNNIISYSELSNSVLNRELRFYSSGMVARLAFSIVFHVNNSILILDEVFAVGDKDFLIKSRESIRQKIKMSNIAIITSHNEKIIKELCNKALILDRGEQKFFGNLKDGIKIYNSY